MLDGTVFKSRIAILFNSLQFHPPNRPFFRFLSGSKCSFHSSILSVGYLPGVGGGGGAITNDKIG